MNINRTHTDNWFYYISTASITLINIKTSNNQRLGSTGNNDSRSKRFCSSAVLCSDRWQMVKACMIKVRSMHFIHSQWSPNECWLHTRDACVITTWRLRLRTDFLTPGIIRASKRCEEIKFVMLVRDFKFNFGCISHNSCPVCMVCYNANGNGKEPLFYIRSSKNMCSCL